MKVQLTHNKKLIIEPKFKAVLSQTKPALHFQLETNEYNISIIKDIKQNFVNLNNSGSFFFLETKEKTYFFNTMSFYEQIPNNFIFAITLINNDGSRNIHFDNFYLSFNVKGFKIK